MPTLLRFLVTLLVLGGLVGAGMIYLANFVEPTPRDLTVRIPADRLEPKPRLPSRDSTGGTAPVAADPDSGTVPQ